jgi:hypothetical protein
LDTTINYPESFGVLSLAPRTALSHGMITFYSHWQQRPHPEAAGSLPVSITSAAPPVIYNEARISSLIAFGSLRGITTYVRLPNGRSRSQRIYGSTCSLQTFVPSDRPEWRGLDQLLHGDASHWRASS